MSRLHLLKAILTLNLMVCFTIPVPVNCVLHTISFEPSKMFNPCKNNLPTIQTFFDLSNLDIRIAADNTLAVEGSLCLIKDAESPVLSASTILKQKLRGRWIELPYRNYIPDFCKNYFKEGTYWGDHVTNRFVGDERLCPPPKNLPLPINVTLTLDMDFPTRMPNGEYMTISTLKNGKQEACFEFIVDILQK